MAGIFRVSKTVSVWPLLTNEAINSTEEQWNKNPGFSTERKEQQLNFAAPLLGFFITQTKPCYAPGNKARAHIVSRSCQFLFLNEPTPNIIRTACSLKTMGHCRNQTQDLLFTSRHQDLSFNVFWSQLGNLQIWLCILKGIVCDTLTMITNPSLLFSHQRVHFWYSALATKQ